MRTTAEIGAIKFTRQQRMRGQARITFLCGRRALLDYRLKHRLITEAAALYSTDIAQVPELIARDQALNKELQHRVDELQTALLAYEAEGLRQQGAQSGGCIVVAHAYAGRDAAALRTLASQLIADAHAVALLGSAQGDKVTVIFARGEQAPLHAGNLLRASLQRFGGGGGGRPDFAQGGGIARPPGRPDHLRRGTGRRRTGKQGGVMTAHALPQVALESTVISHGLPYPHNLALARDMEAVVRSHGAACTVGIIAGELIAGLDDSRDAHLATRRTYARSAAATCPSSWRRSWTAPPPSPRRCGSHRAGIEVFATGGIGGVHRGHGGAAEQRHQRRPGRTGADARHRGLRRGQSHPRPARHARIPERGVTVAGLRRTSSRPSTALQRAARGRALRQPAEVAAIWRAKQTLGLPGGLLVTVPIAPQDEIPAQEIEPAIAQAVAEAEQRGLRSAEVTPSCWRIAELTGDRSLRQHRPPQEQRPRGGGDRNRAGEWLIVR